MTETTRSTKGEGNENNKKITVVPSRKRVCVCRNGELTFFFKRKGGVKGRGRKVFVVVKEVVVGGWGSI